MPSGAPFALSQVECGAAAWVCFVLAAPRRLNFDRCPKAPKRRGACWTGAALHEAAAFRHPPRRRPRRDSYRARTAGSATYTGTRRSSRGGGPSADRG